MRIRLIAALVAGVLALAGCGGAQKATPKQYSAAPAMQIDPNKQYIATIKTSLGDIKVELFAKDAPKTVNNFVFLAREKFYDGIIFHRIINGFMVQTGDPQGTGAGGPGYRFEDELPPKRSYDLGIVAMANAGPNTNGSQFFICNATGCGGLDNIPNYTQFGRVIEGQDVLQKISSVETVVSGREKSKPVNPPTITTVIIEEK
jgi:cyclophilin family peptidyl-prolyl cis-trans isomerase